MNPYCHTYSVCASFDVQMSNSDELYIEKNAIALIILKVYDVTCWTSSGGYSVIDIESNLVSCQA